jgi:hypothetical protein
VHNFPPFAGECASKINQISESMSVGVETRTENIAALAWSAAPIGVGCARLNVGSALACAPTRPLWFSAGFYLPAAGPRPAMAVERQTEDSKMTQESNQRWCWGRVLRKQEIVDE